MSTDSRDTIILKKATEFRKAYKLNMQRNLTAFIEQTFYTVDPGSPYYNNWHIDAIAEALTACTTGDIKRLIINIPPRSLKSISATIAWPAWILGNDPSKRIMAASYSSGLSIKHNVDCRLVMDAPWYKMCFPDTKIAKGEDQKQKFTTTKRGFRLATSVGGTATGEGGDILIVDDPTNPIQAASNVERENANTWFDQTFATRLDNKETGVIVVIMQRLHEADLSGHLLAKNIGWEHLSLPAEMKSEKTISIGNFRREVKKGELMFPQLLGKPVLDNLKVELGSFGYGGQYDQNPIPAGGGILKTEWWRLWPYKKPPPCEMILQVYDTAYKEKEEADYTARTTWGVFQYHGEDGLHKTGVILLESKAKRWEFPELREEVKRSAKEYEPDLIIIEDKGSGISLGQELRRTTKLPIRMQSVKGDKVSRAYLASAYLEGGAVWYIDKEWAKDVIKQCAQFPKGLHDDIVDTCTMCWNYLRKRFRLDLEADPDDQEYGGDDPEKKTRFYG